MSLDNIYKYGYGLLKLDMQALYSMDLFEFLERVEGSLLWHEHQLDETLNNFAWYTANIMLSSGNMPKGTDPLTLKSGLYKSIEDLKEESKPEAVKRAEIVKKAEEEKARLRARFGLEDTTK